MDQRKVLLVDDNQIDLVTAKFYLEDVGFNVDTAKDGYEALLKYQNDNYELLVVDLLMPRMTGLQLIQRCMTVEKDLHSQVIVLSGRGRVKDIEQALSCGVSSYIVKPINPKVLEKKLSELLSKNEDDLVDRETLIGASSRVNGSLQLQMPISIVSLGLKGATVLSKHLPRLEEEVVVKIKIEKNQTIDVHGKVMSFISSSTGHLVKLQYLHLTERQELQLEYLISTGGVSS